MNYRWNINWVLFKNQKPFNQTKWMDVTHFKAKNTFLGVGVPSTPQPPPSLQKRFNTPKRLIIELNLGHEFNVKLTYALSIFVVCAQYSIRSFWRLFLEILPFRISHLQSRMYSKTIIYPHYFYGSTWYLRNWTRVILIKLDSHLRNKCSTLSEFYWCIISRS